MLCGGGLTAKSGGSMCVCRYWYNNGCLFPDMGTVFIAIDKCDQENGCLKVTLNSEKGGRKNSVQEADRVNWQLQN